MTLDHIHTQFNKKNFNLCHLDGTTLVRLTHKCIDFVNY